MSKQVAGNEGKPVVVNEHTLGFLFDARPSNLQVLRSLYRKGGYLESQCPPIMCLNPKDTIRPATPADFEEYRMHPGGFFQ